MAIENANVPSASEEPPQTIPELYLRLATEFDHWTNVLKKGFQDIKLEPPEVEPHRDEKQERSSVDLQRHVDRLQREVDLMNLRFGLQESEIAFLKKALRDLESRIDFPPSVIFCPTCGTVFKPESSSHSKNMKAC